MPQMAPISWLILFFIFSMAFMMFNVLNYYCFNYKSNINDKLNSDNKKENIYTNKLNWKW